MSDRCVWCHRTDDPLETIRVERPAWLPTNVEEKTVVVHPNHEEPVRTYYAAVRQHGSTAFRLLIRITLFGALVAIGTALRIPPAQRSRSGADARWRRGRAAPLSVFDSRNRSSLRPPPGPADCAGRRNRVHRSRGWIRGLASVSPVSTCGGDPPTTKSRARTRECFNSARDPNLLVR